MNCLSSANVDDSSGLPRRFGQSLLAWLAGNDIPVMDDHSSHTSTHP